MFEPMRVITAFPAAALSTALSAALVAASAAAAQVQPPPPPADSGTPVRVVPGAEYEAGALRRFIFGDNWRDLWTRELTVPILDLDRFAGGLTVDKRGGNQTRTLHFEGADGQTYIFRSIHKYVRPVLPSDLQGTVIQSAMEEFLSAMHPGGAFVAFPLQERVGLLTEPYWIRVMPDDPRLGEFREDYAGLVGQVVVQANEGPEDTPGTFGYRKITGSDRLLERLEESPHHRVDEEEMLAAKLVDFLVGDTDRGLVDQWRWAGEDREAGGVLWRPIARDRDWAFMNAEGPLSALVRRWYEKVVDYSGAHSPLSSYVWQDQGLSRRLLTGMDREEWMAVVDRVVAALDDAALAAAVDSLPPEMEPGHAEYLLRTLQARRNALPALAEEYYEWLATDVDIRASDEEDWLEARREADGSLVVTLYAPAGSLVAGIDLEGADAGENGANPRGPGEREGEWRPYYHRRFLPTETEEVRVYLHGGDDRAVVRGEGRGGVTLRVIGGGGDDELVDAASPSSRTAFYDHRGENRIVPGRATHVSTKEWEPPAEEEGFFETKTQDDRVQDWGSSFSWVSPVLDYREGAGIIVGGGPKWTEYGFRHHPYEARIRARLLFATRTTSFGAEAEADLRRESSRLHTLGQLRATPFEAMRFYGFGNDSPPASSAASLVMMEQLRAWGALAWDGDDWELAAGPLFLHTDREETPLTLPVTDAPEFSQIGALARLGVDRAEGALPTHGFELDAEASAFPAALSASEPFGTAWLEGRTYVGLRLASLALRAGAERAWGDVPVHEAPRIGGLASLRGYRWQRFAGDAALYGGAELRVPLFRVELLTRGSLGVLGLADAGRVYVDGESPGGWHTGYGAGLFFATLGQAVSVTWARGEEDRFYLSLGMPF